MTLSTTPRASCPQCGGFPDFDEEGKAYTCYFCCDTGTVDATVAAAYWQDIEDFEHRFAPRHLGIFVHPMQNEYDWDDDRPLHAGHRLFTRLIPPAPRTRTAPARLADDDLPF